MPCWGKGSRRGLVIAWALAGVIGGWFAPRSHAAEPIVRGFAPRGGQQGAVQVLLIKGERLSTVEEVMFSEPGIRVESIEKVSDKECRVRVRVEPSAALGEFSFRLRGRRGVSSLQTFRVGPFADVQEFEPNTQWEEAQPIGVPSTVNGRLANEDQDMFQIDCRKGQRISVEVEAVRLGVGLTDPYVALLNSNRFELVSNDDHPLFVQDACVSTIIPEDGAYYLKVRESSYLGGELGYYRMHVYEGTRPLAVYPAGGPSGSAVPVRFIAADGTSVEHTVAADETPGTHVVWPPGTMRVPSGLRFRSSPFPNVLEPDGGTGSPKADWPSAPVPVAFNGIIGKQGEQDWFCFEGKKGQPLSVTMVARRVRSALDGVINVYYFKDGKLSHIGGSDDFQNHPDGYYRLNPPVDGKYFVRVNDHLADFGPAFVYRVEVTPESPSLAFTMPEYERNRQDRQAIAVPQGGRVASWLTVNRERFGAELKALLEGLPEGVTAEVPPIPDGLTVMPVVFTASTNAPMGGAWVRVEGASTDPKKPVSGGMQHDAALVRANPNNTVYYQSTQDRWAVAVAEPAPFRVELVTPQVPLVHGGTGYLDVKVHRDPGFDEEVRVRMLYSPPGISTQGEVAIAKGQTTARLRMNANYAVKTLSWPVAVLAKANHGGTRWVSSQFKPLEVAPVFVSGKIEPVSAVIGTDVDLVVALTQSRPFSGEATLRLQGLPHGVEAAPQTFTTNATEVVFKVKVTDQARVGKNKNVFCAVELPVNGGTVLQSIAGGGQLRIDPVPIQLVKKAAPAPVKPVEKKEAPKRLSRLEQLRLQAKGAGGG